MDHLKNIWTVVGFLAVLSMLVAAVALGVGPRPAHAQSSNHVIAWGFNTVGQLGDGTSGIGNNKLTPVDVLDLADVTAISAGDSHSLAVRSDGTVWAWGNNRYGQLGDGTSGVENNRDRPVEVVGLTDIVQVSAGHMFSTALESDGTLWTWGRNYEGQLGDGTTTDRILPAQVADLTNIAMVSASAQSSPHVLALKSDGTVWAWGDNWAGQLGNKSTTDSTTPIQVGAKNKPLTDVAAIAAGGSHSLAVKTDGTVWAWGNNLHGELGDGTDRNRSTPILVDGLTGMVAADAGGSHSLALGSDGSVWSWGKNQFGQLGDGTETNRNTPVQVLNLSEVVSISAGGRHSQALSSDGKAWAWGHYLGVGDGTTEDRDTPVHVEGTTGIEAVAAGINFGLATTTAVAPSVSWSVPSIQVTAERGTSDLASVTLVADGDTSGASVAVDSTISSLVTAAAQRAPFDLVADVVYNVPIVIDVPTTTELGSHVGDVSIVSSTGQVMGSVAVTVEVVDPPTGTLPSEVSTPSRDRIGADDADQPLILDELVVGLDFGVVDPEQTVLDIAAAHNGVVLGSVPDALTYQLWLPEVADLNELELVRQSIATEQGVDFASTAYLSRSLSVVPDDPLWDSWDENNPDGNNWNLELINAPSAWDINTGNRIVPVAIIDGDIDADHVDLAGNIDTYVGEVVPHPESQSHGTHVAGIACAEGNNGIGVSGVAWQCSLRGYEFGFSVISDPADPMTFSDFAHPANSVFRMVDAANDGARAVNLSVGARRGDCLPIDDPNGLAVVEQQNDIWGRGVLYAEHIGQDILWVIAAGNWECDARFVTPASLSTRFPRNVITVASVNSGEELSSFSNFGDVVTVAAPGGEPGLGAGILSTVRPEPFLGLTFGLPYGEQVGTSMAAPHVSGLAALVLSDHDFSAAQTKACIVAGAEDNGIPLAGHAFSVIDAPSAIRCEGTVALPPQVDLVFSLDLTGSMSQEIDQIKLQINEIMAGLRDAAPDTDFQFGVVSYEDYNGTFDSSICTDSTYNSFYGGGSDEPFRIDLPLTGDDPTVAQTINNLTLGGGGDGPQSYGRVFWEVSQADTMSQLGFRPEALKLLVDFGDNIPHDSDLNEGIEPPLEPPFPSPFDTGYDPGRNDVIDCGADDIDFQDDAIPAMVGSDVHLVHIDSSGSSSLEVYWNLWTSQTGGEFAAINSDGTVPEGQDLTQLIIELLQLIP